MTDIVWPADIRPKSQMFYLQPHVGGAESPITRTRKVYGLSAPRWITKLSFERRAWGRGREAEISGLLDALVAKMEGGLNRVQLWDFRREFSLRPQPIVASPTLQAVPAGATVVQIAGFAPYSTVFLPGDYIGGDGRPHMVTERAIAGPDGVVSASVRPPFANGAAQSLAVLSRVSAPFRLSGDDSGSNDTVAGQRTTITLSFVEDLG